MTAYRVTLECGDSSTVLPKETPEGYTHEWEVYVKGIDNSPIHHFIEKVVFNLHSTFTNPERTIKDPPYVLKTTGYAGFVIPIHVYLKNKAKPKKFEIMYDLDLDVRMPARHVSQHNETFHNPTDEFRKKLLKGGATPIPITEGNQEKKEKTLPMVGKPKLSGNESKKHKISEPKVSNQFSELFGTPIQTAKVSVEKKDKPSEKSVSAKTQSAVEKSEKVDKSTKTKPNSHKDIKKERSNEDKKEKKEKEKEKDVKEKNKEKSKTTSSPGSAKTHRSSLETNKKPVTPPLIAKRAQSPSPKSSKDKDKDKDSKKSIESEKEKEKEKDKDKEKEKEKSKVNLKNNEDHKIDKDRSERKKDKKKHKEDRDKEKKDKHKERDREKEKDKDKESTKNAEKVKESKERLSEIKANKDERKSPKLEKQFEKEEKPIKTEKTEKGDKEKLKDSKDKEKSKHKHRKRDKKEKRDGSREREKKERKEKSREKAEKHPDPPIVQHPAVEAPEVQDRESTDSPASTYEEPTAEIKAQSPVRVKKEPTPPPIPTETPSSMSPPPAPTSDSKKDKSERKRDRSKSTRDERDNKKKKRKSENREDENSTKKNKEQYHSNSPLVEPVSSSQSPIASGNVDTHLSKTKPIIHLDDEPMCVKEEPMGDSEQVAPDSTNSTFVDTEEPLVFSEDYVSQLKDLQRKIMTLQDDSELQRVVQVIADSGQYEVTKKTFDFDLCALDRRTVQRLQQFFAT